MASTEEIRTDLAEIVNDIAGVSADDGASKGTTWA